MRQRLNTDRIYEIIQADYGKEIADKVLDRYKTYVEEKRKENRRIPRATALAGALAYIELRKRGEPVVYEEIAELFKEDSEYIRKITNKLIFEYGEKLPFIPLSTTVKKLIGIYSSKLGLDEEETKEAISLYESIEKDTEERYSLYGIPYGVITPRSIAGACIYLAKEDELSLEEISDKIDISEISLRKRVKEIEDIMQKIKEEEKQEFNLQNALKKVMKKLGKLFYIKRRG